MRASATESHAFIYLTMPVLQIHGNGSRSAGADVVCDVHVGLVSFKQGFSLISFVFYHQPAPTPVGDVGKLRVSWFPFAARWWNPYLGQKTSQKLSQNPRS